MADETEADLLIVGGGPAGMAAAVEAASHGLSVVLVDEQPAPGGQIYRGFGDLALADGDLFGAEFGRGSKLISDTRAAPVRRLFGATLWHVSGTFEAAVNHAGGSELLKAKALLVATGALERPFPIGGWTRPGVMTAGSAQVALKSAGALPDGRIVLAGGGPLLYLVATQLLRAGAEVSAVLDTTPAENYRRALANLPGLLRTPSYLTKGLAMLAPLRRRGLLIGNVADLSVEGGKDGLEVVYRPARDTGSRTIEADWLLLHQGIVPNIQVARSLDCEMRWSDAQVCFVPVTDEWGETSVGGVFCAGDGAGIGGAHVAALSGRLAAQRIALMLAAITERRLKALARPLQRARRRHLAVRPFLDTLYRPPLAFRVPANPDVLVCRCEEVSAAEIERAIDLGASGPNQAKFFTRCGMGPCQGRMCGLTVTEMIAERRGSTRDAVGYFRVRPPIKPVRLADLAAISSAIEIQEVHF
jgi:octopine oxidase subunit A